MITHQRCEKQPPPHGQTSLPASTSSSNAPSILLATVKPSSPFCQAIAEPYAVVRVGDAVPQRSTDDRLLNQPTPLDVHHHDDFCRYLTWTCIASGIVGRSNTVGSFFFWLLETAAFPLNIANTAWSYELPRSRRRCKRRRKAVESKHDSNLRNPHGLTLRP